MEPGGLDNVFIATFGKATKTFRASLLLCDRGFGQQSAMLNRSLFEQMVLSWWIVDCVDDEEAVMEAIRLHRDHASVLFRRGLREFPDLANDEKPLDFTPEHIEMLDQRFGRFGGQWYEKSLATILDEIKQAGDQDNPNSDLLWKLYRFVNAHSNAMLHHSALAITDVVDWPDAECRPIVSVGPDLRWRSSSLWAATFIFGLLVAATLQRLSPEVSKEFDALLDEVHRQFTYLSLDDVKDVGRNDQCPCESGRKFKHCHEQWT